MHQTDNGVAKIGNGAFLKKPVALKILLLLQSWQKILQILHKYSQLNFKRPLEAGFVNLPTRIYLEQPKAKI